MSDPQYDAGLAGNQPAVYCRPAPLWARLARDAVRYTILICAVYGVLSMAGVV